MRIVIATDDFVAVSFNVPVADAAFRYREPARRGPRG